MLFLLEIGKLCTWIYVILFVSNNQKLTCISGNPLCLMLIINNLKYLVCGVSLFPLILLDSYPPLVDFIPLLLFIIILYFFSDFLILMPYLFLPSPFLFSINASFSFYAYSLFPPCLLGAWSFMPSAPEILRP